MSNTNKLQICAGSYIRCGGVWYRVRAYDSFQRCGIANPVDCIMRDIGFSVDLVCDTEVVILGVNVANEVLSEFEYELLQATESH